MVKLLACEKVVTNPLRWTFIFFILKTKNPAQTLLMSSLKARQGQS